MVSEFTLKEDYSLRVQKAVQCTSIMLAAETTWEYNLTQEYLKADREKSSLSLIYDDECTRLTFSFETRYQDLGSSTAVKSLMFRVQLKPFANVVFSQGRDQITF